ncbi:hypothetical protein ACIOEX_09305 [Streptomyces sp. NPDC087850]|uniref:hypothetical protein n=1 Tax=unclassified Streptomyces TaxID=2593676 RepID=UPI00381AF9A2
MTISTGTSPSLKPWLVTARVLAVLTVATVVLLFGSAGVLVQDHQAEGLHGAGAILLHITSGLLTVALGFLAWRGRMTWIGAVVSGVLFVVSFVQAAYGSGDSLSLHVPGAFLISAGSVGLATWLFVRAE